VYCFTDDGDEADSVDDTDVGDISDLMDTCCNTSSGVVISSSSDGRQVESALVEDVREHMKGMSRFKRRNAVRSLAFRRAGVRGNLMSFVDGSISYFDIGTMDYKCAHCGAKYYEDERNSNGFYTKCCSSGKIILPKMKPPSKFILDMLTGCSEWSTVFHRNPRMFNTKVSFSSVSLNPFQFKGGGKPALRISGSVYHNIGDLMPAVGSAPSFLQVFFFESNGSDTNVISCDEMTARDVELMKLIRVEIKNCNEYLKLFEPIYETYKGCDRLDEYVIKLR
jgi:DNA-directed RNA polymerase subunit RPC12/RpoP